MPMVSVIIPVYNAEKYLQKCVNSVLNQTIQDIEIILVDDGSTDGSSAICDDYGKVYTNIKVIHKKNGGLSSARNAGMNCAVGEFIGFVDSDDYIDPFMYEKLWNIAHKFDADIAMCNYDNVKNNNVLSVGKIDFPVNRRVDYNEISVLMQTVNSRGFLWFVWKSIFRRKMLIENKIRFIEGNIIEDTPFNMEAMLCSNGVVFCNEPLYHYEQSDNSLMRVKHKHDYLEMLVNLYNAKLDILSRFKIECKDDLFKYTIAHTLPLLLENELHYKRKISEKINIYRTMRNSPMIDEAMQHISLQLIRSRLKYLAMLLKYRCYFLLAFITN